MMYELIIQPPAVEDLDLAYQWIAERSPQNAARWFNRFVATLETLKTSPERCELAPESQEIGQEIR